MVEGLRSGRPLVKFRRILPIAALLFVTASTYRYFYALPHIVRGPYGIYRQAPRMAPLVVAQAVNLPATVLALPLELVVFGPNMGSSLYYQAYRIVEFSVLGAIFWFFAGRFLDDLIAWRAVRSGSRWRLIDCLVAGLIAVESTLLLVVFNLMPMRDYQDLWLVSAAVAWAMVGYSALIFRIVQFRSYPRIKERQAETEPAANVGDQVERAK